MVKEVLEPTSSCHMVRAIAKDGKDDDGDVSFVSEMVGSDSEAGATADSFLDFVASPGDATCA